MQTYLIADVARETGFEPTTLRYYESIGLIPTPPRAANGYRRYDDRALARLRFIGRAKQLGCTLDEIGALVRGWDGDDCEPVQDDLRAIVDARISDARGRIVDLLRLTGELQRAADGLDRHPATGACGDECACVEVAPDLAADERLELVTGAPEIACTLPSDQLDDRLGAWQSLIATASARHAIADGVRLDLPHETVAGDVAALAVAEQACCTFFRFDLTIDQRGLGLEVTSPGRGQEVIAALFGAD